MTDTLDPEHTDELLSRLTLIEDQELESRATSYAQLHDQLSSMLEGGEPRLAR